MNKIPTYDFKCAKCDTTKEEVVPLADYDKVQSCDVCGEDLERLFPMVGATHGDEAAWLSDTTEFLKDGDPGMIHRHPVSSRTEYTKLLREKGLEPAG